MKNKKNGYIYYEYHKKTEKEEISETAWRSVFHWLYAIVGVLFVFVLAWVTVFHVISVEGDSMQPTLQNDDKLFVYTFDYTPRQGDIVLISMPGDENPIIKRVIALENQTVDIDYKNSVLTVDGKTVEESYVTEMTNPLLHEIAYPYTVPSGCVFVLGDNRNDSVDSRNTAIGSIDMNRIAGKAVFRLYPFANRNIYD